jgi:FMN reductase (NADPH)
MKMNETIKVMMQHRSIRQFQPTPVEDETLEAIVLAAQRASTSSNVQAYSVIAVKDAKLKQELAEVTGNQRNVLECPLFLVWCADLHRNQVAVEGLGASMVSGTTENLVVAAVDASLAAQNAAVAAESLGLGIVYVGGIRNDLRRVSRLLGLPKLVFPVFGMCVGYPAHDPGLRPRLPLEAVLHREAYATDAEAAEAIRQYDADMREYYVARTGGKRDTTWSQEMAAKYERPVRTDVRDYLVEQGFMTDSSMS